MSGTSRVVGLLLAASLQLAGPVQGQDPVTTKPSVALWLGGESVPTALDRTCGSGGGGMAVFGGSLVVPVGSVALEGRMGGHWRPRLDCAVPSVERGPGIYTERQPAVPGGNFTSLDLRVRWIPVPAGPWTVTAGGGWAASSKDVPYLVTSVGVRSPVRSSHLGLELELAGYRVPWTAETTAVVSDPESGDLVSNPISRRSFKEWAFTVGVRLRLDIPFAGAP